MEMLKSAAFLYESIKNNAGYYTIYFRFRAGFSGFICFTDFGNLKNVPKIFDMY